MITKIQYYQIEHIFKKQYLDPIWIRCNIQNSTNKNGLSQIIENSFSDFLDILDFWICRRLRNTYLHYL